MGEESNCKPAQVTSERVLLHQSIEERKPEGLVLRCLERSLYREGRVEVEEVGEEKEGWLER